MTIELDLSQLLAVQLMVSARFACVTGGAGCGKTTSLSFALDEMDRKGQSYRLAAPTGKAAKRMTETTGRAAMTIHRLLGFRGTGFQHNRHNPLETTCVIIDEASMLDIELTAALLDAVDPNMTRVILMGDANQLPPVGPGFVFGDLVNSGVCPVARLTTLHRQAVESWINVAAQAVLRREMPDLHAQAKDFRFVNVDDAAQIIPAITNLITKVIPLEYGSDAQVLIPQKPGAAGIIEANIALQAAVNPLAEGEKYYARKDGSQLRCRDRVIQTRNNYDLHVFNGEIGQITDVAADHVVVDFPDHGEIKFTLDQARDLQLAYALTVHKTQGSEFPWIVFLCHHTHAHMLSPQLIYTAMTRGKRGIVLVGSEKGMRQGLRQENPPRRNTGLIERIRGEIAA